LKELANLNKHRELPVLARRLTPGFLAVYPDPLRGRLIGGRVIAPIAGTQELARVELEARYGPGDTDIPSEGDSVTSILHLKIDMSIVFGRGAAASGRDVVQTLTDSARAVALAIDELEVAHRQSPLFT
jgi:hypothetical protein